MEKKDLVITIIVCIAISGGVAYAFTSSRIATLTKEKADLQSQIDYLLTRVASLASNTTKLQNQVASLTEEKTSLETQINTLNSEKTGLQTQVYSLTSDNTDLNNSIGLLAETIDAMHSSEWVQKASYNISAGTLMNQTFVLDKYGIVWETIVDFTGSSVRSTYYYWYNGTRNFVISFARSLLTNSSDGTYLGPQDYLYGTIKIDISPDWKGGNRIWIGYSTRTQLPGVSMGGNMYVDVDS